MNDHVREHEQRGLLVGSVQVELILDLNCGFVAIRKLVSEGVLQNLQNDQQLFDLGAELEREVVRRLKYERNPQVHNRVREEVLQLQQLLLLLRHILLDKFRINQIPNRKEGLGQLEKLQIILDNAVCYRSLLLLTQFHWHKRQILTNYEVEVISIPL